MADSPLAYTALFSRLFKKDLASSFEAFWRSRARIYAPHRFALNPLQMTPLWRLSLICQHHDTKSHDNFLIELNIGMVQAYAGKDTGFDH